MHDSCPRCGANVNSQDKFCGFCGFNLSATTNFVAGTQMEMKLADIHFNLGVVYFKNGKYTKALELFEKLREEAPENAEVLKMLEKTQNALNNKTASSLYK